MRRSRRLAALVTAALLLAGVGADHAEGTDDSATGAGPEIDTEASLRWAVTNPVTQLDPHKEVNGSETNPIFMIYDRLFYIDAQQQLQPMLATDWSFSDDGTQLTITLRDDAVFHDGSPVDAEAVKASIERVTTLEGSTMAPRLAAMTAVDVLDPLTVQFSFNRPASDMPYVLATNVGSIVNPRAIAENLDLSRGDHDIAGSGPWIVSEFAALERVDYTRASTPYWDPSAGLVRDISIMQISDTNTIVNSVASGQADVGYIVAATYDGASAIPDHELYTYSSASVFALMLRDTREPFDDPLVRRAVATAIDRTAITEQLLENHVVATYQPFLETSFAHSPTLEDPYPYNVESARAMLAEAGFPDGIEFTAVIAAGIEPSVSIATAIQAQLAEAGITMNIDAQPVSAALADFPAGRYDAMVNITAGQPHPSLWVARNLLPPPDGTFYHLASGEPGADLTAAVYAALAPIEGAALTEAWDDVNRQIVEGAWLIPVAFQLTYFSFPTNVLHADTMSYAWAASFDPRYIAVAAE